MLKNVDKLYWMCYRRRKVQFGFIVDSVVCLKMTIRRIIKMIIDTHAHYDDEAFDPDREVLLASMQ